VDFIIHGVLHHDVPPLEIARLAILVPMPNTVLQHLMVHLFVPFSGNTLHPVDVHQFTVIRAFGETKRVVAMV
jgi:hypothetical protein